MSVRQLLSFPIARIPDLVLLSSRLWFVQNLVKRFIERTTLFSVVATFAISSANARAGIYFDSNWTKISFVKMRNKRGRYAQALRHPSGRCVAVVADGDFAVGEYKHEKIAMAIAEYLVAPEVYE